MVYKNPDRIGKKIKRNELILMPWGEKTMEQQREHFVKEVQKGEQSKTALCAKYGISRVTGDKWLARYEAGEELSNQSRAPRTTPKRISPEVEEKIVSVRLKHPAWGARKILRVLENNGETGLPAQSTVCEVLKRNGLVSEAASQAATPYKRFERKSPNELWQVDFKGHFATEDGKRCYPLTAIDDHSRFALCVDAKTDERLEGVIVSFTRMFNEYGLPYALLCDNGNPWGASQSTGYTRFTVWMMKLDVHTIHCRPHRPQTQGKEERFNRTLKAEALNHPIADLTQAQYRFDAFRDCYNYERPHAALNMDCPASRYKPSQRTLPNKILDWEYPSSYQIRKIKDSGYLSYNGWGCFLSEALGGETVALHESNDPGRMDIFFRNYRIAVLDLAQRCLCSRKSYRVKSG